MTIWIEFIVLVLVLMACWGGLALAKASHQREGSEREALSGQHQAALGRTLRHEIRRDLRARLARRVGESSHQTGQASRGPVVLRQMGIYATDQDRRAQVGLTPKDAA